MMLVFGLKCTPWSDLSRSLNCSPSWPMALEYLEVAHGELVGWATAFTLCGLLQQQLVMVIFFFSAIWMQ